MGIGTVPPGLFRRQRRKGDLGMTVTIRAHQFQGPKGCTYRLNCPQCERPTLIAFEPTAAVIRQSCLHFRALIVSGEDEMRVEFSVEPE